MAKRKVNTRALQKLAVRMIRELVGDSAISHADRDELAAALVRQWMTYDGSAVLFIGKREHYLLLDRAWPDRCSVSPESGPNVWLDFVQAAWKVSPEQLPDIVGRLNRGQSAEVINGDGVPVRLWVNPREKSNGVEPLVRRPVPPERPRDYYCKIAASNLSRQPGVAPGDREAFAAWVAKQWQTFGGHASLFLGGKQQMVLTLTEGPDGGCEIVTKILQVNLTMMLSRLGLSDTEISDAIARINVGAEFEFRDRHGFPSAVWYDPGKRSIVARTTYPPP